MKHEREQTDDCSLGGSLLRGAKTLAVSVVVGAVAVVLAVVAEKAPLGFDYWGSTICMLSAPAISFLVGGLLARTVFGRGHVGSYIVACIAANALLHYFGCGPLWQKHPGPGLVFDSVWLDLCYHLVLIGVGWVGIQIERFIDARVAGRLSTPAEAEDSKESE